MKKIFFILVTLGSILPVFAQEDNKSYEYQPFESIGKKVEVLTLTDGKYKEFHGNDSLVRISSVLFNKMTGKVVSFIEMDTIYSEATMEPEIVSRWLSPDPLQVKYPQLSPYSFVGSMPIIAIDPNGKEIYIVIGNQTYNLSKLLNPGEGVTLTRNEHIAKKIFQQAMAVEGYGMLVDKYKNSQDHDVYFVFGHNNTNTRTLVDARSVNSNGGNSDFFNIDEEALNTLFGGEYYASDQTQKDFKDLNGIDISYSSGVKNVSLVALNSNYGYMQESDMLRRSNPDIVRDVLHELGAHVEYFPQGNVNHQADADSYGEGTWDTIGESQLKLGKRVDQYFKKQFKKKDNNYDE